MQRELYRVVVTSKPTNVANTVLRRMGLSKFFELVIGGDGGPKSNLLSKAIAVTHSHPSQTLMIGDRKYDVDAALNCGAHSIAVAYGYGKPCELTSATAVVGTVDELGRTIDLLIA